MIPFSKLKLLYKGRDNLTNLKGMIDVDTFSVNFDLLNSTSSEFNVYEVPNNLLIGDLVMLKNFDGTTIFSGVVSQIEELKITCSDLTKILDYSLVIKPSFLSSEYYSLALRYFLRKARDQCQYRQGVGGSLTVDELNYNLFNQLLNNYKWHETGNKIMLGGREEPYNIRDEMFSMASKGVYTIIEFLDKPENGSWLRMTTDYFKNTDKKIDDISTDTIAKNVIEEEAEVNKLLIYDNQIDDDLPTACYYLVPSGITDNPNVLSRNQVTKTKAVWRESGQGFREVATQELAPFLYSHKIELEVAYDGKYIDWSKYNLGEKVQVYVNGKTYDSIYTGCSFEGSSDGGVQTVKMIFGKVRNRASQYWLQKAWQ